MCRCRASKPPRCLLACRPIGRPIQYVQACIKMASNERAQQPQRLQRRAKQLLNVQTHHWLAPPDVPQPPWGFYELQLCFQYSQL